MEVIRDIHVMCEKLKAIDSHSIGLIQVKSVLHEGHAELIRKARAENFIVIVVKIVAREEFISEAAFKMYPKDETKEIAVASISGADFLFIPPLECLYQLGHSIEIAINNPLAQQLGGAFKKDYYQKRLNTTCLLLNMIRPSNLYLSNKDLQLVYFTKQLLLDLYYDTSLKVLPRIRDEEGLILSSKNALLHPDEKRQALHIYEVLKRAKQSVDRGTMSCKKIKWAIENEVKNLYLCKMEFVEIVDTVRLTSIETIVDEAYIMLTVRAGKIRIGDYIKVSRNTITD